MGPRSHPCWSWDNHRGKEPPWWCHNLHWQLVVREQKSGWAYSAKGWWTKRLRELNGMQQYIVKHDDGENALTLALTWVSTQDYSRILFVTDSLSALEKVRQGNIHADWYTLIKDSSIRRITWIYCPGHAGVIGNETADRLARMVKLLKECRSFSTKMHWKTWWTPHCQ